MFCVVVVIKLLFLIPYLNIDNDILAQTLSSVMNVSWVLEHVDITVDKVVLQVSCVVTGMCQACLTVLLVCSRHGRQAVNGDEE